MTVTPELLLEAYRAGVFPMAEHRDDPELFWVDPRRRGIFPLKGFHISRSLARRLRRGEFTATLNTCADHSSRPRTASVVKPRLPIGSSSKLAARSSIREKPRFTA